MKCWPLIFDQKLSKLVKAHDSVLWATVTTSKTMMFHAVLADNFPFLPSQILASAFPALDCSGRVAHSTFSANLHVEPVLLGKRLLERIHYRQIVILRILKLSNESNHP